MVECTEVELFPLHFVEAQHFPFADRLTAFTPDFTNAKPLQFGIALTNGFQSRPSLSKNESNTQATKYVEENFKYCRVFTGLTGSTRPDQRA